MRIINHIEADTNPTFWDDDDMWMDNRNEPIVRVGGGHAGRVTLPCGECGADGGRGATALPRVIANFKHLLSARYGFKFQRDFFDTRLRDDAHYAEKFQYILGNPVRKGLCAATGEWPYSIAFNRETGDAAVESAYGAYGIIMPQVADELDMTRRIHEQRIK